jgi:hypothetical protein
METGLTHSTRPKCLTCRNRWQTRRIRSRCRLKQCRWTILTSTRSRQSYKHLRTILKTPNNNLPRAWKTWRLRLRALSKQIAKKTRNHKRGLKTAIRCLTLRFCKGLPLDADSSIWIYKCSRQKIAVTLLWICLVTRLKHIRSATSIWPPIKTKTEHYSPW